MNAYPARRMSNVDVDNLERFDALVSAGARSMRGWHFQSVDLRGRSEVLLRLSAAGSIFMGCSFAAGVDDTLRSRGALLFPRLPGIPFNPYRGRLYSGPELYKGIATGVYEKTPDAQIYQWALQAARSRSLDATLATAMHDHAISDALDEALADGPLSGAPVVGVMGGHASPRGSADYATAARLGRLLARQGCVVATGGGPGAMEAANLGAYLARENDDALDWALSSLAQVPGFRPSVSAWARAAAVVLERFPAGGTNLGIPTWFYGHEPPNAFATHIAKYFANSIREAMLLERCRGGIIFLPGAAGTVQEIFQDGCENYYAADQAVTPMVLLGRDHWERTLPVWPLLATLAGGRAMSGQIHCVDSIEDAVAALAR